MKTVKESGMPELKAFAIKLSQGKVAVFQVIIPPCDQDHTEGTINRLKPIKRSIYDRGRLDLLKQRTLYASIA